MLQFSDREIFNLESLHWTLNNAFPRLPISSPNRSSYHPSPEPSAIRATIKITSSCISPLLIPSLSFHIIPLHAAEYTTPHLAIGLSHVHRLPCTSDLPQPTRAHSLALHITKSLGTCRLHCAALHSPLLHSEYTAPVQLGHRLCIIFQLQERLHVADDQLWVRLPQSSKPRSAPR
jgi:hypothetical protein